MHPGLTRDVPPPHHDTSTPCRAAVRLLVHTDAGVRARVCNLVGNMCRHSAYFYGALDRHGLIGPLIDRCMDPDKATRKFACFAIGNAGERGAVPSVCMHIYMTVESPTYRTVRHPRPPPASPRQRPFSGCDGSAVT